MNAEQDSRRLRPEVAQALEALLARPYRWGAPVEVGALGDLAERDRLLAVAECIRIVETRAGDARDLGPDLYAALRAMQPAMNDHGSEKHARIAIDRELFFERHLPLDVAQCAGAILKASLRAMPDGRTRCARWCGSRSSSVTRARARTSHVWPSNHMRVAARTGPRVTTASSAPSRGRSAAWVIRARA